MLPPMKPFLYPTKFKRLQPFRVLLVPCEAQGFIFEQGQRYLIRIINKVVLGDVSFEGSTAIVHHHQTCNSPIIKLPFTTDSSICCLLHGPVPL